MLNRLNQPLLAVLLVVVATAAHPADAQNIQDLPRRSPHATITQRVGMTEITIDYHRPSVNDREIWGHLVPYGAVWRAGANDNTTITFSTDVEVEGQPLTAGTYGLHMWPTENAWSVIFSTNSTSWGSFTYDAAEDALRVDVTPVPSQTFEEQLRYGFDGVTTDSAVVTMHWEKLSVPFSVATDTHNLALAKIRNDLRHLPRFSWQGWNSAANYCLQNDINHEEALQWVERSISMNENATNLLTQAGLLQQANRSDEAKAAEERALELANEVQTNAIGYTFLLQRNDVDKAIEIFKRNVDNYPDSWNVYDSLGEALAAKGEAESSVKYYSKALAMAPDGQKARIQGILDGLQAK